MGTTFWVRRFLLALTVAFVVIAFSHWVRGRGVEYAAIHGGIWSLVTAAVFTLGRYWQARRGRHCAICRDTPEMQGPRGPGS